MNSDSAIISPHAAQEQLAFTWIVGKLASFSSGLVDIPIQPEEPFVKVLHLFNQKVPSPLDYSTWRKKIYNRVQYIKRRQKEGKRAPLYKSVESIGMSNCQKLHLSIACLGPFSFTY